MSSKLDSVLEQLLKQESRSRLIGKEVHTLRSQLENVLFRLTAIEDSIQEVRANSSEVVPIMKKGRGKKSECVKNGGIAGWEALMHRKFPNIHLYFPQDLWTHAILYSVFEHVHTHAKSYSRMECIEAVSGVLLARKNHAKKDIYESPIGKSASAFRKLVLVKALDLARAKTYPPTVKACGDAVLDKDPFWLGPDEKDMYIRDSDIAAGQKYHETKTSNTTEYHRRVSVGDGATPERSDYAAYIMITLYDIMNRQFISRRRRVRNSFCESLGYLFMNWAKVNGVHVDDQSLRLVWKVPFDEIMKLEEKDIRACETEDKKGVSADKGNRVLFKFLTASEK